MTYYIKGTIVQKESSGIVLDNNGIGYYINVSTASMSLLELNNEAKIYIYETNSMYSQASSMYGFLSVQEMELFEIIKSVNKIGAKGAIDILSRIGNKINEFKHYIISSDVNNLNLHFGFTKQKAEKLVLGLKNKIQEVGEIIFANEYENDAIEALKILGYSTLNSKKIVSEILKNNKNLSLEEIIRLSLKRL